MSRLDRIACLYAGQALAAAFSAWLADVPMSWLTRDEVVA